MNNLDKKTNSNYYNIMDDHDIIKESYANNLTSVRALVEAGHDINAVELETGFRPLHIAACRYIVSLPQSDLWPLDRWQRSPSALALAEGDGLGFARLIERETAHRASLSGQSGNPEP